MEYPPPRERLPAVDRGRLAMAWHGGAVGPVAIVLLLAAAVSAGGDQAAPMAPHDDLMRADTAAPAGKRLREGARLVDQIGNFKLSADRASFTTADGQYQLDGLPNLNLERIVRTLRDHPNQLVWSVSGTVTEYQGANYILITRAVLKSKRSRRTAAPVQPPGLPTPSR